MILHRWDDHYWRDNRVALDLFYAKFNGSLAQTGEAENMLKLDYPDILKLFTQHRDPKRSESAAFLIWYLENYYRLDTQSAIDSVCDQRGDKGVDGIFVNDNDETITIFQATIAQKKTATIGDKSLREFAGTLTQFSSQESIAHLVSAAGK